MKSSAAATVGRSTVTCCALVMVALQLMRWELGAKTLGVKLDAHSVPARYAGVGERKNDSWPAPLSWAALALLK